MNDLRHLADRMAAAAGKRIAVTPESARIVVDALHVYADQLARPRDDHHRFTVDVYDDRGGIIDTMAQCSSLLVGKAAYAQAIMERPTLMVTLRQGIRIIEKREVPHMVGKQTVKGGPTNPVGAPE